MDVVDAIKNRLFGYKYNLTLLVLAVFGVALLHSPVSLEDFLNDHFVFLTGAYRIMEGQIPHVDFQSPLGGLSFLLIGLVHDLSGSYAYSIPVTTFISSALIIGAGSGLLHRKLDNRYYTLAIVFCALVCVSPYVESSGLSKTTYAMWYNRHGWAAFIFASLYFLHRGPEDRIQPADVACLTVLSVLLAYTKPTFLIALVPTFLVDLLFYNERGMYYFAASALLVAVLVELAVPGFSLGYIRDLLSASDHSGVVRGSIDQNVMYLIEHLLLVLCVLFAVVVRNAGGDFDKKAAWGVASVFVGTWWLTNQATQGMPLGLVVVPIWAGSTASASPPSSQGTENRWVITKGAALFGLALLVTVPTMGKRLWALTDYVKEGYTAAGDPSLSVPFEGFEHALVSEGSMNENVLQVGRSNLTMTSSLCTYADDSQKNADLPLEVDGFDYVQSIQDAVDLTERHVPADASVLTFDFVNPVNLLTGRPPITGTRLWYHKDRTFNSDHLGPPETWLRDVTYVLVPAIPVNHKSRNELLRNAGCFLENRFEPVERTAFWILLRKTDASAAPSPPKTP